METISRTRRPGGGLPTFAFPAWLRPFANTPTRGKAPGLVTIEPDRGRLASAWGVARILLYRLVGLSPWAARRLDIFLPRRAYRRRFGRNPDLVQPSLFSEKVMARRLFDRRPAFSMLTDKLQAREFAAARIGMAHLPRLLMVCERFDEIDFDRLPDKFVIKANHGAHWVLFVDDKAALDRAAARQVVNRWLRTNYYVASREYFYKDVKPRIMVEEFLKEDSGAPAIEYRLYTFDGKVKFFSIQRRLVAGSRPTIARFTRSGERLPDPARLSTTDAAMAPAGPLSDDVEFPANLEKILEIGDRLGQGFDFIRVDLYNPGGQIRFGEMTSLPMGGVLPFNPMICEEIFGREWNLQLVRAKS